MAIADLDWLIQHQQSDADIRLLSSLFPDVFSSYFKVFFPLAYAKEFPVEEYRYEPDTLKNMNKRIAIGADFFVADQWEKIRPDRLSPITYLKLAEKYQLAYDAKISYKKFLQSLGHRPVHIQRSMEYELQTIRQLVPLLGPETSVNFYGFGGTHFASAGAAFQKSWQIEALLSDLRDLYLQLNDNNPLPFPLLPSYVVPDHRQWIISVSKILGTDFLMLGANDPYTEKLVRSNDLEVMSLSYHDAFTG